MRLTTLRLPDDTMCLVPTGGEREARYVYHEVFDHAEYLEHWLELPANATVIDVGAHIGLFTLFVKRACPTATVVAFEPMPPTLTALLGNIELHDLRQVTVHRNALGSHHEDAVTFTYYPEIPANSTRYPDRKDHDRKLVTQLAGVDRAQRMYVHQQFTVSVDRLSSFLRPPAVAERIDLLKVDVEGAELDVLAGIDEADWRRVDRVIVEVQDVDGQLGAVIGVLARHGFATTVKESSSLPPEFRLRLVFGANTSARP